MASRVRQQLTRKLAVVPARDLVEACDAAAKLARATAQIARDRWDDVRSSVQTKSSSVDLVTEVDRDLERFIVDALVAAFPDDSILGEEGATRTGSSGYRWVVDPIDGTTNYVYGFPQVGVSIALVDGDDRAVAGAVADIARGRCASAAKGLGATLDGLPVSVRRPASLGESLIATGFSYDSANRADQAHCLTFVLPRVRDIRRGGSAALDLCSVATGAVDAYYEQHVKLWDVAAGLLIAAEAGAITATLPYGTVVAASPTIADELMELLLRSEDDTL